MSKIAGDGDRLDNSTPADAGGVSPGQLVELQTAVGRIDAAVAELGTAIAAADQAVNEAASWANVAQGVVDLVEGFVPIIRMRALQSGAAVPAAAGLRGQVIDALVQIWRTPKDRRAATATALMQTLLAGLGSGLGT